MQMPVNLQAWPAPHLQSLQVEQFSVPLQLPSPQTGGQAPQSSGQFEHVSEPSQ